MQYTLNMEERRIVWDENKNIKNKQKHKIGFDDAQYMFADIDRIERIEEYNVLQLFCSVEPVRFIKYDFI